MMQKHVVVDDLIGCWDLDGDVEGGDAFDFGLGVVQHDELHAPQPPPLLTEHEEVVVHQTFPILSSNGIVRAPLPPVEDSDDNMDEGEESHVGSVSVWNSQPFSVSPRAPSVSAPIVVSQQPYSQLFNPSDTAYMLWQPQQQQQGLQKDDVEEGRGKGVVVTFQMNNLTF